MKAVQKKLKALVVQHTVKMSVISALNLPNEKYDTIKLETDLAKDLGIDSLDAAEIIMRTEEDHGLDEIPEDYARKATTLKHIYDYVLEHCDKPLSELVNLSEGGIFLEKFLALVAESFPSVAISDLNSCASMQEIEDKVSSSQGA